MISGQQLLVVKLDLPRPLTTRHWGFDMNCEWVKSSVTLYIYDELPDDARYELEQHVERCAACAGDVKSAQAFKAAMALPAWRSSQNPTTAFETNKRRMMKKSGQCPPRPTNSPPLRSSTG